MKIAAALILLVALSSCVAVPAADPYTQRAAADGAIIATQAARNAQATNAAILASAAESDAAATIAVMQQEVKSTQLAVELLQTQYAVEQAQMAYIATATAAPVIATSTAQVQQTQTALMVATEERENNEYTGWMILGMLIAVLSFVGVVILFGIAFIRWIAPAIDAKYDSWKEKQRVFEKSSTVFVFVPQLGRAVTLQESALVTNAVIGSWAQPQQRFLINDGTQNKTRRGADEPSGVVRLMLDAKQVGDLDSNIVPGYRELDDAGLRWGSGSWQSAIRALESEGLVYTIGGSGTYVDEKIGTLDALITHVIRKQRGTLPSPTADYVDFDFQHGYSTVAR